MPDKKISKALMVQELEQRADGMTTLMVKETLTLLHGQFKNAEVVEAVCAAFIAKMMGSVLFTALTAEPSKPFSMTEAQRYAEKNYNRAKCKMMDAVASAFTAAMSNWTKKDAEYYCIVKPVPMPDGKWSN